MNKNTSILALLILVISSCTNKYEKNIDLEKIEIFDKEKNLTNRFYLNSFNQKDSIEVKFQNGKPNKKIYWSNGTIDSIRSKSQDLSSSRIVVDSVFKELNTNDGIIQKSEINEKGEKNGFLFRYKDSILKSATQYVDGVNQGLVVNFNQASYPTIIGDFQKGSFYFGIQFHKNGRVKTLRINNKENRLGLIYHYYPNGNLKSRVELLDGSAEGDEDKYAQDGKLISKKKLSNGIPIK